MVDIILTSFNRPDSLGRALQSVLNQSDSDWKLWVLDDGSDFDIIRLLMETFRGDDRVQIRQFDPSPDERKNQVRYAIIINAGLTESTSENICYLCDDDYLYPGWIAAINRSFSENQDWQVMYGKLMYVPLVHTGDLNATGSVLFPENLPLPFGNIDHCQVAHRRFCLNSVPKWKNVFPADGYFFTDLSRAFQFHPVDVMACQKGMHEKNLLNLWNKRHKKGHLEGPRE